MTVTENITFNALDVEVKSTDILFEEVASSSNSLPSKYLIPYQFISNQGTTPDCTAHGQAGATNENNGIEAASINTLPEINLIDPVELGKFWHSIGAISKTGGYINWALKYLIKWGYISGFSIVNKDVDSIKRALVETGAIVTGSNKITWSEFDSGFIAKYKENSSGHCFRIDGYDDEKQAFRIANSWGESWGDKWSFWIKYSDIVKMVYTCYALHDVNDTVKMKRAKAKKIWVWNWERENDKATRRECVIIAYRLLGKNWSDYDLLTTWKFNKVYNWEREEDVVTLFEAKVIFSRVGVPVSPKWITRWELVECIS